jgi:hypothetical protein
MSQEIRRRNVKNALNTVAAAVTLAVSSGNEEETTQASAIYALGRLDTYTHYSPEY